MKEEFLRMISLMDDPEKQLILKRFLDGKEVIVKDFLYGRDKMSEKKIRRVLHDFEEKGVIKRYQEPGAVGGVYTYVLDREGIVKYLDSGELK